MTRSADPDRQGVARPLTSGKGESSESTSPRADRVDPSDPPTHPRIRLNPVFLVLLPIVGLTATNPVMAGEVTQVYAEAERVSCGPRAVFALARRLGCDLSYETVRSGMQLTADGSTIHDLKKALIDHGVVCGVRRLDPTQLLVCPTPLIVHVMPRAGTSDGHFLVVTRIGTDGLQTIDPIVGRGVFWKWQSFSDAWSGFAIIPETSSQAANATILAVAALAVHLLALAGLLVSTRGTWWSLRTLCGRGRNLIRVTLVVMTSGFLAIPAIGADEVIRTDSNDGVNAAALLAGINGTEIRPGRAAGGGASRTLGELQSLLTSHSVTSSVRRLTYDDLIHRTGPCIVPLKYGKDGSGNFYTLLFVDAEYATVVRAGPLLVSTIPVDEFRRRWTGHAIVLVPNDFQVAYLAAAGAAVFPPLAYVVARRRRRSAA